MAYKKLSEATFVENIMDTTNVLIEENDEIKRVPKSVMGKVKTVNGAEPDENGNVEIEADCDWNRMANKPFGEEIAKKEVIPALDVEMRYVASLGCRGDILNVGISSLEVGKEYIVSFDGVEYTSECTLYNGMGGKVYMLGNDALTDGPDDTGEPFRIELFESNQVMSVYDNEITEYLTHTVAIYEMSEIVKTLDSKYLPNTGGAFVVNLGIDDNGDYFMDKTFEAIRSAIKNGCVVLLYEIDEGVGSVMVYFADYSDNNLINFSKFNDAETYYELNADNTVVRYSGR